MPDSDVFIYFIAELAVLLLVICVFLLLNIGSLKKLIRKLEEKILSLRQSVGLSRKETKAALKKLADKEKIKPKAFLDYLDEEIEGTRSHHQSLNPDRDIVLDITPDTPVERQAASLRHAFLIAEKEARYAGDADNSSWDVLQAKFQQIIQFYQSMAPAEKLPEEPELPAADDHSEEIENYKKRIENLERFKKLFFDMEGEWESAKKLAEDYCQQLMAMGKDLGAGEDFEYTLNKYSQSFQEIEGMIADGVDGENNAKKAPLEGDIDNRQQSVGKMVMANQEEMQRLRNMAVDQHKVITELKKKLYAAKSAEEQQVVIEELSHQLEQQERFLQEAETCTRLIEDELSRTLKENEALRHQIEEAGGGQLDSEEAGRLESMLDDLTNESKEMLGTIALLEKENQSLRDQVNTGANSDEHVEMLTEKMGEMQQELLNLQTQHIELEERYLELKMK